MRIKVAHSPDSDDAFMFYALAQDKIDTAGFEFEHHLSDIESLNRAADEGKYELTAVSIHAYAYLHETYALMNSGASMGEGYGPILVAPEAFDPKQIKGKIVAVPGTRTSAFLALKLYESDFDHRVVPFDHILETVESGGVDAGLVIHEGQLSYADHGLHNVLDLGEWWKKDTGLPLPLGGNVARRDLGESVIRQLSGLIQESIRYAFAHREDALAYALDFGRGLDARQGAQFVDMYVNERTLDYGADGRAAVRLFLDRGHERGVIPHRVDVEFY
jgi:1,4-dihydroxy-6-naphthoate synthase